MLDKVLSKTIFNLIILSHLCSYGTYLSIFFKNPSRLRSREMDSLCWHLRCHNITRHQNVNLVFELEFGFLRDRKYIIFSLFLKLSNAIGKNRTNKNTNLVSDSLKKFGLIVKNSQRSVGFLVPVEYERYVTSFPSHVIEIHKSRIHSDRSTTFMYPADIRRKYSRYQRD